MRVSERSPRPYTDLSPFPLSNVMVREGRFDFSLAPIRAYELTAWIHLHPWHGHFTQKVPAGSHLSSVPFTSCSRESWWLLVNLLLCEYLGHMPPNHPSCTIKGERTMKCAGGHPSLLRGRTFHLQVDAARLQFLFFFFSTSVQ